MNKTDFDDKSEVITVLVIKKHFKRYQVLKQNKKQKSIAYYCISLVECISKYQDKYL